MKAVMMNEMN